VQFYTRIVCGIVDNRRPPFGYQIRGAPCWEIDDLTLGGT
jgi:hypothetical protein